MNMIKPNFNGFSMIEVLVTIMILMIGLLGLAGLQARALTAQMESYQRGQALFLLKDMADRINANRKNADYYIGISKIMGTDAVCPAPIDATPEGKANEDLCEWHNALLGSAEKQAAANVGAMIGARGCVYKSPVIAGQPPSYVVVVAWQGFNNTKAPDATAADSPGNCGKNKYLDKDGNPQEKLHRVVSLPITMATLGAP
jgi:type IV pilus assembly protein PilV